MEKEQKKNDVTRISRKEYKLNQKVLIFIFFLALSTIFWLLNALDHNFSTNITFPIKYIHQRPDKEMVDIIPNEISLNVSGHGYALLREIITNSQHPVIFRIITLNFNEIPGDTVHVFLLTKNLKENIQRQLGSELALNYISPDTLYYTFSQIVRKKVRVEPNLEIEFEKQFMLGGNIFSMPDSIYITGPRSAVDSVESVRTIQKRYSLIDKSFSEDIKLQPLEGVSLSKKTVTISVPVEKYTEAFLNVPIKIINIPDSLEMKLFPTYIKVNYIVALRNYNKVTPWHFRATVDYKQTRSTINNKLRVMLERQPAVVRSVNFRPKNVDFIIVK